MSRPSVYIETTVVSYLTAWPSGEPKRALHQAETKQWWELESPHYHLVVSDLVIEEASAGDLVAASERLAVLEEIDVLETTPESITIARALLSAHALPEKALGDALHLSIAAVNNVHFLLTWNCRHLANARQRPIIESVFTNFDLESPIICTPEELVGGEDAK